MHLSVSDFSDDLEGKNIKRERYGDVLVRYYDRKGEWTDGYICDFEWDTEDANKLCMQMQREKDW